MKEDFKKFYDAGADLVLSKPMKKGDLLEILQCFEDLENSLEGRKKIVSLQLNRGDIM